MGRRREQNKSLIAWEGTTGTAIAQVNASGLALAALDGVTAMNNSSQLALLLVLLFSMPTQASQPGATDHSSSAPQSAIPPGPASGQRGSQVSPGTGASSGDADMISGPGGVKVRPRQPASAAGKAAGGTGARSGTASNGYSEEAARGETRLNR